MIVSLQRGLEGQNLGENLAKFRNGELHQGLRGSCGDLLGLENPKLGRAIAVLIRETINKIPKIKSFFASIVFDGGILKMIKEINL